MTERTCEKCLRPIGDVFALVGGRFTHIECAAPEPWDEQTHQSITLPAPPLSLRQAAERAVTALVSLSACDDPHCPDKRCLRALPNLRLALEADLAEREEVVAVLRYYAARVTHDFIDRHNRRFTECRECGAAWPLNQEHPPGVGCGEQQFAIRLSALLARFEGRGK